MGSTSRVVVTRFASVFSPWNGEREEIDLRTWAANPLVHRVTNPKDKKSLPVVSFATFRNNTRLLSNVIQANAIGIDVDDGTPRSVLGRALDELGFTAHVNTTISSTPAFPKWRVVFEIARAVTAWEHDTLVVTIGALLHQREGIKIDMACRDASRAFYVPARQPGAPYRSGTVEGEPVYVDEILDRVRAGNGNKASPIRLEYRPKPPGGVDAVHRAREYLKRVPGAVSGQGGHRATFIVASRLVHGFGLDDSEAIHLLREWNTKCSPTWSERELQHKISQARERGRFVSGTHGSSK